MVMGSAVVVNAKAVFGEGARKVKWAKAFSLVPFLVIPHFDLIEWEEFTLLRHLLSSAPNTVRAWWIGIDEDTALVVEGGTDVTVMGKGRVTVVDGGTKRTYGHGATVSLPQRLVR